MHFRLAAGPWAVLSPTRGKHSTLLFRAFSGACLPVRRAAEPVVPNSSIKTFRDISPLRQWRRKLQQDHRRVGLVPTMGALHEGHLSLIRLAAAENSAVVVSIYVNPAQFGVHEDLDRYPRTWEADCKMLSALDREFAEDRNTMGKILAVFAPTTETMYPSGWSGQEANPEGSFVVITPLGERLEGASRPTFFRGVATVCMKLFNIVMPDKVYFGQKDVQQTVLIRKMVKDLCMDTQVAIGETVREEDGLAMSSRNTYLGPRRRKVATVLSKALRAAETEFLRGHLSRDEILGPANGTAGLLLNEQQQLPHEERALFEIEYISLADPETMEELDIVDKRRGAILSGAVRMLPVEASRPSEDLGYGGGQPVRLIDSVILKPVQG